MKTRQNIKSNSIITCITVLGFFANNNIMEIIDLLIKYIIFDARFIHIVLEVIKLIIP